MKSILIHIFATGLILFFGFEAFSDSRVFESFTVGVCVIAGLTSIRAILLIVSGRKAQGDRTPTSNAEKNVEFICDLAIAVTAELLGLTFVASVYVISSAAIYLHLMAIDEELSK